MKSVQVKIPATSANLGPGFDTFGMALSFYDEYSAIETPSGLEIVVNGEGAGDIPLDETNLIYRSLELVFRSLGKRFRD